MSIVFDVPGDPDALKRARVGRNPATGHAQVFDPQSNKIAKGEIVRAWQLAGGVRFDRGAPVRLTVSAAFRRPAGHYGTGRNAGRLKDSAPLLVTKIPDADNIAKLVGDALNGYAWHDDSQIAEMVVRKVYLDPVLGGPHLRIAIEALDGEEVAA